MIIAVVSGATIVALVSLVACCLLKVRKSTCARSAELPAQYCFEKPKACPSYFDARKLAKKIDYDIKRAKINRKKKIAQDCSVLKRDRMKLASDLR